MPQSIHSERHARLVEVLIRERKRAGLTQADVAKALGRYQSFIAGIESGQRRVDIVEFLDLAEIIGFDPQSVVRELRRMGPSRRRHSGS
jgi:HTH-type transcriptional regulator/antitoxin HipB